MKLGSSGSSSEWLGISCLFMSYCSDYPLCCCALKYNDYFCRPMNIKSDLLVTEAVFSSDMAIGAKLRIGWQPDRICVVRHLGSCRFVAEQVENAKMQVGDTFSCIQFQKGRELHLEDYSRHGSPERYRYVAGINTGITVLEILQ